MLLAVDPSLNSPGIALFNQLYLVAAGRLNTSDYAEFPDGRRWLAVARSLYVWALPWLPAEPLLVTFERPQVYTRDKSKGDPNHLVGIAGVAACFVGILSAHRSVDVHSPHPGEWIGQLPKTCPACKKNLKKCRVCKGSAWNTPRGKRIRSCLTPYELALVPDQNDAIDAVGLGLWALGRLEPHKVFSNGRDGR